MPVIDQYTAFALAFGVPPSEAHVLPALFERAARSENMTVAELLQEATYRNILLGMYIAESAHTLALENPSKE